jgi:hypothetical protein
MFLSTTSWIIAVTVVAGLLALAVIAAGWERRPHNAAEWTAAGWPLLPVVSLEQLPLLDPPAPPRPSGRDVDRRQIVAPHLDDPAVPPARGPQS